MTDWIAVFYRAVDYDRTGEIRGDVNGRNFLLYQRRVCGIDFELPQYGWIERDLETLLAYVESDTLPLHKHQMTCFLPHV